MDKDVVVFRKFPDGEVIALFPEYPGTNDPYNMSSYVHVGQHGCADEGIVDRTKLATPGEYADLAAELRSIGYALEVRRKLTWRHNRKRASAIAAIHAGV